MVINTENVQVKRGGHGNQQEGHFLQSHSSRSTQDPEKHSCCGGIGAKQETFSGCEEAGTEGSLSVTIFTSAQGSCRKQRTVSFPVLTLQAAFPLVSASQSLLLKLEVRKGKVLKSPRAKATLEFKPSV